MESVGRPLLDPQRLAAWHDEYAGRLRAFLLGVLRDRTLMEEAVQTTFAKALTHGADVRTGGVQAWLFQVAYREAMALRRRQAVQGRVLKKLAMRDAPPGVDASLVSEETAVRVRGAVNELPDEQQQVVLRRMDSELTFQQIADELRLPLGTVLTRMRLALRKLQTALKDAHDDLP